VFFAEIARYFCAEEATAAFNVREILYGIRWMIVLQQKRPPAIAEGREAKILRKRLWKFHPAKRKKKRLESRHLQHYSASPTTSSNDELPSSAYFSRSRSRSRSRSHGNDRSGRRIGIAVASA
jgi:hypothetical protein